MNALLPFDKRWQQRREKFVVPDVTFRPEEFGVEVIAEHAARAFVVAHHYSASFPVARLSVGLIHKTGTSRRLVGVAVFSVPMQQAAIPRYTGLGSNLGVELGRFVLLPDVAFNGESWFLRRAFLALRAEKTEVRAVLSYADPMERHAPDGMLTKPAHYGQIYQASNATFGGRAKSEWLWLTREGQVVSRRSLSKIRNDEVGRAYAERQLIAAGADPRHLFEEPRAWLERVLREPTFRRLRHPGNFAYVFGLDRGARAAITAANDPQPYPKARAA